MMQADNEVSKMKVKVETDAGTEYGKQPNQRADQDLLGKYSRSYNKLGPVRAVGKLVGQ
jgi:hypothetical protein